MTVEILRECDNYIVVNKPYDVYVNSDDQNEKNTVAAHIGSWDSHLSTSDQPLHFVHRLDYATSGILCVAKNKMAAKRAGTLLETRAASKYYVAVVRGLVGFACACIEYDIGEDPTTAATNHTMLAVSDETTLASCVRPRTASTRVLLLETGEYDGGGASVLLLKPHTGRRHQLRVHCVSVGHVVLGDVTYSGGVDREPHRMFLHARRLVLPFRDETMDIQTPEPFNSDEQFRVNWKSTRIFHEYRTREQFSAVCDVIDKMDVDSDNCKRFTMR